MAGKTASFDAILTRFRPLFNVRSFAIFALLVTGWLLAEVRGLPSEALHTYVRHADLLRDPLIRHVPQNFRKPSEQWIRKDA